MKRQLGIALVCLLTAFSTAVLADGSKIGVVDLQKIMQTSDDVKTIQATLEEKFKPRRDKIMGMEADLKKDMEAFKRDSSVLSQAKRKELEQKIMMAQQTFEQQGQQYQQELSAAHNEAMEKFYDKIRAAIAKVAEAEKYDLVFQKDAAPFSVDKLDVTSKVIKAVQ
jgi:outer membrane protein|tara:strand:- start:52 stop:552 length:501 start_codon:yes stop_codon:yes gene_type:complete